MSKQRSPLSFNLDKAPIIAANAEPVAKPEKVERPEKAEKPVKSTAASRAGRQFIAAHVNPEAAKQFKLLAVQTDRTTQSLLVEAINDLFAKNGVSRIAEE